MENIRRKMRRFVKLIPFEEALSRIREAPWRKLPVETIESAGSHGRIAAEDLIARGDVPEWNRSLVDGFAVISDRCQGASDTNPLTFEINGIIEAGSSTFKKHQEGSCTEIYTGGILPAPYDSVIMAEDVEITGNLVRIFGASKPWENVEKVGEDIRSGSTVLRKSEIIRPWHVSALVSSKTSEIKVYSKIRIGVIATGNELFEGSQGYIPNTTQNIILNYLSRRFTEVKAAGIAHDSQAEIASMTERALEESDVIILTGGTSLGGKDEVPEAMQGFANLVFAGSMIRPGRTLTLYEANGKPIFSVSGIPIPSLLSLDVFFEEYLKAIMGLEQYRKVVMGRIGQPLSNKAGYAGIYRIKLVPSTDGNVIEIVKSKGSGTLTSILDSDGTLIVPGNIEGLESGKVVQVKLYGDNI